MLQGWFKCLRKNRRVVSVFVCNGKAEEVEKSLSLDCAENLAESDKGLLLRPGAMTEGVERAANCRMRPVCFHLTIYNLLKIWKAKLPKQKNQWLVVFVKVVFVKEELKLWRIYLLGSTWMFQWQNETCPSH